MHGLQGSNYNDVFNTPGWCKSNGITVTYGNFLKDTGDIVTSYTEPTYLKCVTKAINTDN